ncbi:MAG TPA: MobF family relaxase, partial [Mycobacteriales bacterium]|nr:MobF family relaxase [Mycobacteriales bacterium]
MSYYTDRVAPGIEDYYAGRGEAQGEWLGSGAAAAELDGLVTGDQLRALFDGRHPVTGEPLGASYVVGGDRQQVRGWDLTFSAPKSVSVLWAVGGGDVGMEVRDAHQAAVRSALTYLEEHAAFSRTGKAGIRQVDTRGLVAAAFVHRTSRSGDPQLHTHVLVSNRVQCDDGTWRALDGKALHRQLKPAGMLYHAALRAELTMRLGVAWTEVNRHGQA